MDKNDELVTDKYRINIKEELIVILFLGSLFFEKLISNYLYLVTGTIIIIYSFTKVMLRKRIVCSYGLRWQVIFVFISVMTLFQSIFIHNIIATEHLYVLFTSFFILLAIAFIIDNHNDCTGFINRFLLYFAIWGTLFSVFIIITEWDSLGIGRLGSHSLGDKFGTATAVSFYTITTTCVLIWSSFVKKKNKLVYVIATVLSMYLNFMTGGRKAVLLPMIFLIVFINIHFKKRIKYKIKWGLLTIGILFLIFYASLNITVLYEVFGYRLIDTIDGLLGKDISSTETIISNMQREMMIKYGISIWMKSPLVGNGFGLFHELAKEYGLYRTYAHNNYVDLLVSGGIILSGTYYWIHFKLFKEILAIRKKYKDDLLDFFFSMIVVTLISDFFTTSYYLVIWNVFIIMAASYVFKLQYNNITQSN